MCRGGVGLCRSEMKVRMRVARVMTPPSPSPNTQTCSLPPSFPTACDTYFHPTVTYVARTPILPRRTHSTTNENASRSRFRGSDAGKWECGGMGVSRWHGIPISVAVGWDSHSAGMGIRRGSDACVCVLHVSRKEGETARARKLSRAFSLSNTPPIRVLEEGGGIIMDWTGNW